MTYAIVAYVLSGVLWSMYLVGLGARLKRVSTKDPDRTP